MQVTNQNVYTLPCISPRNPKPADLDRGWYVWFRFYDPTTRSFKQLRYKQDINQHKDLKERMRAARALADVLKEELKGGWNPLLAPDAQAFGVKPKTLIDGINFIMKLKAPHIRQKTKEAYKHITGFLQTWITEHKLVDLPIDRFSSSLAQQYMDQLLFKRSYSGRTFNDHLTILGTFFNVMVARKWCPDNPFHVIKRMKSTIGRNLAFSEDEKVKLRKTLHKADPWMYYFSQFIYFCFIRRTELARVRVSDVDLHNKTIVIRGEAAKNDHQESVVIPVGLEPILEEMKLSDYPDHFFIFGRHLFPSEIAYVNVDHISARHNKFCKKMKMDQRKGLYSWKHTGVCAAYYATNKDVYSIMRQLRHRDLTTTMIYLKSLGLVQNDTFRNSMIV